MRKPGLMAVIFMAAIIAGCASSQTRQAQPVVYTDPADAGEKPYVAPQSAPVLPPSYPSLAGDVVQIGTASIPLVQGR